MKILIAGGGTGGHIYPVVSIAKTFIKNGDEVVLVGRENSKEENIYKSHKLYTRTMESAALEFSPKKFIKFVHKTSVGIKEAYRTLKEENIDTVIGAGGYVSAPIVFAAITKNIPIFLYEQNIVPGRANRLFAKKSKKIFIGFPDIYGFFDGEKTVFTGNPIRKEIADIKRKDALNFFKFDDNPTLLVLGGSGGAKKINDIFSNIIKKLLLKSSNIQIIFITGERDYQAIIKKNKALSPRVKIIPYLEEAEYAIGAADFAISRAGAMTLTELTRKGVPGIIIPYPHARDNHQEKNALFLKNKGCIDVIKESTLSENMLLNKIIYYLTHPDIIKTMKNNTEGIFPENSEEIMYDKVRGEINE